MKRLPLSTLLFFIVVATQVNAQFLHADGTRIVNEEGQNVLLRGIGLGGWMLQEGYMMHFNGEGQQHRIREKIQEIVGPEKTAEFYQAWLANHTRKSDVDSLKAWGFNSIRLPMHFELYTLHSDKEPVPGQNTWLEQGFRITDSLLAWCKDNQVYLILDMHAAPGGQGNDLNISDRDPAKPSLWESKADQAKMIALWHKLAERYANEPWIAGYDIINEPNWGFTDLQHDKNGTKEEHNEPLGKFMQEITAAIREVDTKHIVIIEGNGWGNNYRGIEPTWDKNLVLSFHKYWNYNDTASISHILRMREKYNIPAWLGETGENSNVWFTQAIRLFESNNLGWAWWPLKKIGGNNPEEILSNPDYDALTDYVNAVARANQRKLDTSSRARNMPTVTVPAKPAVDKAYKGLMQLAESAKTSNAFIHRDVIDAMFRQPFTTATLPFKQHGIGAASVTMIPAADFDLGQSGYAYYDLDSANYRVAGDNSVGNRGRVYRNDAVDIYPDSSMAKGYVVGSIEAGEWLQYTVTVSKAGNYNIALLTGGNVGGGKVVIENVSNGKKTAEIEVPATGSARTYKGTKPVKVALDKGEQAIRVRFIHGGFLLQGFTVTPAN